VKSRERKVPLRIMDELCAKRFLQCVIDDIMSALGYGGI